MHNYSQWLETVNNVTKFVNTAKDWHNRYVEFRSSKRYEIVIKEHDLAFVPLLKWIVQNSPGDLRHTQAASSRDNNTGLTTVNLYFHSNATQRVSIEGHVVEVSRDDGRSNSGEMPEGVSSKVSFAPDPCIKLSTQTSEGRKAIIRLINKLAQSNKNALALYRLSSWGSWQNSVLPSRSFDSVILKSDTKEMISNDLDQFIGAEKEYLKWGIPWHRGYLFYGVPGTGKTSLIKALANKLQLDVYFINIASLRGDSTLQSAIADIRKRSILVLEDVDSANATMDRDSADYNPDEGAVTLSGLLNCLDGLMTPHGLITIMTTNHKDKLDPALIRTGRVDMQIELSYIDDEQFNKMCTHFFGKVLDLPSVETLQIVPSDVVEIFKKNIYDPAAAEVALKDLVNARVL